MNKGKLIFVTGLFGAGKTTLTAAAVENVSNLSYLITYTTRPQREGEVSGKGEYIFTSNEEYIKYKSKSYKWDEDQMNNCYYGNDVEAINRELDSGKNLILCIAPRVAMIKRMTNLYTSKPILIWMDTDLEVSNERLVKNGRPERIFHPTQNSPEIFDVKKMADSVFVPNLAQKNDLEINKLNFINLIQDLLKDY
jgi:guanylate kinase